MKVPRHTRQFCHAVLLLVLALGSTFPTIAQPPVTPPVPITDRNAAVPPQRVELGNGKYKRIYRNRAGQIIKEETFEMGGGMLQPEVLLERREIQSVNANGTPSGVIISRFEDIPNTLGGRKPGGQEIITYNDAGEPVEKIQKPLDCNGVPSTTVRIITTWAAGTRTPTVRVQKWDNSTGSWIDSPGQPKPPANTGPGPTSANTTLPNGTTATAQTRVRTNGDDSLLLSIATPQKFDGLQITLPNSRPFTVGSLPQNWRMSQDGKKLTFGGPATDSIDIRLDARPGGETLSDKPIEFDPTFDRKKLFDARITTTQAPPVTKVEDLSSALNLPPEITPGQDFLATPKPGFTAGTWRIANGPAGQWINTSDPNYRPLLFKVAENESPRPKDRVYFGYQYYDQYNELILDGTHSTLRLIESAGGPRVSDVLAGQRFAFAGQSTCARGNSPNWENWFFNMLDGTTPLLPLSASPTTITLAIPGNITPGPHTIGSACPASGQYTINVLGVEGSIDSNKLWTGESTTMRLRVVGTEESLPIVITNNTPNIIDMHGGVKQTVNSSGGPTNLLTRSVKGIMRGGFQIDYRLDYPVCGSGSAGPPANR